METIQITSEDGEQIQFYVVEQTRVMVKITFLLQRQRMKKRKHIY